MASKEENIQRFQEIANRGLQDKLPADKRAIFDEALKRGIITMPNAVATPVEQPVIQQAAPEAAPAQPEEKGGVVDWLSQMSSDISSQINRTAQGMGETALNLGTAAIAEPLSGFAGIGAMLPGGRTPTQAVEETREALTYQPRSEAGIQAQQEMGAVLEPVGKVIGAVEQGAGDIGYGAAGLIPGVSPEAQSATGAIASAIPTAIMEILGFKGTKAAKTAALKEQVASSSLETVLTPEVIVALRKQGFTDDDFTKIVAGDPVQLERLERFQRQNIQPTRGDVTMDTAQRKAEQQLAETAQGESAEKMRAVKRGQSVALQTNFEEMIDSVGIPEDVGVSIKEAITERRKIAKADAAAAYDSLAQAQGGADSIPILMPKFDELPDMPTDRELRSIKRTDKTNYNALQDALAEFGLSTDEAALARLADEGVVPEQLNIQNFEEVRQALNAIRKADESGNLSRVMTPIITELDRQVDIATDTLMTSGNADIAQMAKDARLNWRAYLKEFDPKSLAEDITKTKPRSQLPFTEVSQVYDRVVGRSVPVEQVGRLVETLEAAGGRGNRAIAHLQATVVSDLLDSMFSGTTNKIGDTPVFSGPALAKRFNDPKFNEKIQAIFKNNPEGYRQLEDLVQTAQDLTPGKYEAVKGSGNVMLDIASTMGLAKLTSVPGVGVIMEQFRDLTARSKNRQEFNRALAARPDLKLAANDLIRSFPMLSAALGIGYLSGLEEEE